MDFVIEQRLLGSPVQVQDTLLDPAFIAARADLPKLGDAELLDREVGDTTARLRVRLRFTGALAPAVTAMLDPARLSWVDVATFDLAQRSAEHRIEPDHYADRLSCGYSSELTASGTGTARTVRGFVKVRMLLVGGKVEGAIVSGLREHAAAEAALLDAWLTPESPGSAGDAASS